MRTLPVEKPKPDFSRLADTITRRRMPDKVHLVELLIDAEIVEYISEQYLDSPMPKLGDVMGDKIDAYRRGKRIVLMENDQDRAYWQRYIDFYYAMGFDYVPDVAALLMHSGLTSSLIPVLREAGDTAELSRGQRIWAEEGHAAVSSWRDFEAYPWDALRFDTEQYYRFMGRHLPDGMKLVPVGSVFEQIMERIFGYENLFNFLYDDRGLVDAVFDKVGTIIMEHYRNVAPLDAVGALFHGDDLAFKTSTLLSPDQLREVFFPWLKSFVSIAHENDKMIWYHCCGYKDEIMDDLIEDIGVDAIHSFEDACCPVTEYKKRYGDRVALLGGVDMDKLCRLGKADLRAYVRMVLDTCMENGGFALGAGNSFANYVPVGNYFEMMEEGIKWGREHFSG